MWVTTLTILTEASSVHANVPMTPAGRLRLATAVVDLRWPLARAAERFQCSRSTAKKWADRYRAGQPMTDRSSRPHRSPQRIAQRLERRIVALRFTRRWGPHRIGYHLGTDDIAPTCDLEVSVPGIERELLKRLKNDATARPPEQHVQIATRLGLHRRQILAGANTAPKSWSSRLLRSVTKTSVGIAIRVSRMIFAA